MTCRRLKAFDTGREQAPITLEPMEWKVGQKKLIAFSGPMNNFKGALRAGVFAMNTKRLSSQPPVGKNHTIRSSAGAFSAGGKGRRRDTPGGLGTISNLQSQITNHKSQIKSTPVLSQTLPAYHSHTPSRPHPPKRSSSQPDPRSPKTHT